MTDHHQLSISDTELEELHELATELADKSHDADKHKRRVAKWEGERITFRGNSTEDANGANPYRQGSNKGAKVLKIIVWSVFACVIAIALERYPTIRLFEQFTNPTVAQILALVLPIGQVFLDYLIGRHLYTALIDSPGRRRPAWRKTVSFTVALLGAAFSLTLALLAVISPYREAGFPKRLDVYIWFQIILSVGIHSYSMVLGNEAAEVRKWLLTRSHDLWLGTLVTWAEQSYRRDTRRGKQICKRMARLLDSEWKPAPPYLEASTLRFALHDCEARYLLKWYANPEDSPPSSAALLPPPPSAPGDGSTDGTNGAHPPEKDDGVLEGEVLQRSEARANGTHPTLAPTVVIPTTNGVASRRKRRARFALLRRNRTANPTNSPLR